MLQRACTFGRRQNRPVRCQLGSRTDWVSTSKRPSSAAEVKGQTSIVMQGPCADCTNYSRFGQLWRGITKRSGQRNHIPSVNQCPGNCNESPPLSPLPCVYLANVRLNSTKKNCGDPTPKILAQLLIEALPWVLRDFVSSWKLYSNGRNLKN